MLTDLWFDNENDSCALLLLHLMLMGPLKEMADVKLLKEALWDTDKYYELVR